MDSKSLLSEVFSGLFSNKRTKREAIFISHVFLGIGVFVILSGILVELIWDLETLLSKIGSWMTENPGLFFAFYVGLLLIMLSYISVWKFYKAEQEVKNKREDIMPPQNKPLSAEKEEELIKINLEDNHSNEKTSSQELISNIEITEIINQKLGDELLEIIEEKYGDSARKKTSYRVLKSEYFKVRSRLENEIESLNNRGVLNLTIGIIISIVGILYLGWSLIQSPQTVSSNLEFIAYYLPRTTFVLMVEFFAFFFLNLYRASLNDIKYFQNELTNIELKILSIEALILADNMDALSNMVQEMSKTERNFLLDKNQTTVILEKEKLESNTLESALKLMTDVLGKKYDEK